MLLLHGTPGTRHQLVFDEVGAKERGLRCLNLDRPGYGMSSFHADRTYESFARDVASFLDHYGIGEFVVLGFSAGAPHALGCAAVLKDRVRATLVVSGVPPNWARSERSASGVRDSLHAARRAARITARSWLVRRAPSRAVGHLIRHAPACDAVILSRSDIRANLITDARSQPRSVARSIVQDWTLWESPWDLDLRSIRTAVHVWHGTEDRSVPVSATHLLLDELATPQYHELEGAGHFFVFDRFWELIDSVA